MLPHAAMLAVIVIVFAAAPLVTGIPPAALSVVLIVTAIRMVEVGSLRATAMYWSTATLWFVLQCRSPTYPGRSKSRPP